ncbi:MAG: hypothetical protein U0R44_06505 [Candidatus Micrarchaeia archaeon]
MGRIMLPGFQPESKNLRIMVPVSEGVPMEEAIRKADQSGLTLAPNMMILAWLGRILESTDQPDMHSVRLLTKAFPCWSGTFVAYEKAYRKLGSSIEYTDPESGLRYVFPVPPEFAGERNIALVAEHPDFVIESDGRNRVIHADTVGAVKDFPAGQGFYSWDPVFGIPSGSLLFRESPDNEYLWMAEKRVGLLARGGGSRYNPWWIGVNLLVRPSERLAVVVVENDGEAADPMAWTRNIR